MQELHKNVGQKELPWLPVWRAEKVYKLGEEVYVLVEEVVDCAVYRPLRDGGPGDGKAPLDDEEEEKVEQLEDEVSQVESDTLELRCSHWKLRIQDGVSVEQVELAE